MNMMKSFMFGYNAGCKIWLVFGKVGEKRRLNKAHPRKSFKHDEMVVDTTFRMNLFESV